jgi:3-hydroxybutyrate dehydrogenase
MNTAIVTGAAQGLGLVTARRLAAAGYRVVLTDLQDVAEQAAAIGAHAIGISGDVASEAFVEDMAARIAADFGGAQVLVNNAGISLIQPAEDTTLDQWQRMMAVNLQGPFLLCRAFGRQMLSAGKGSIVNVASVHGLIASPFKSAYVSAKHGVLGLTKTVALEAGVRSPNITCNAICPSYVRTPLVEKQIADQARAHHLPESEVVEKVMLTQNAIKKLIEPEEVARLATFLCGEGAWSITGTAQTMDAGWLAH